MALSLRRSSNILKNLLLNSYRYPNRRYSGIPDGAIPANKIANEGTMQDVKLKLARIMGVSLSYSQIPTSRTHTKQYLPNDQAELPKRTMSDSFSSALIPLSEDMDLREKYVTFMGHVRSGRLLEDMDAFAVNVAQNHIKNPKVPEDEASPYILVTVLVDRVDFTDYVVKPDLDIRLSGHVSWVGRSSIETVVWLEQKYNGVWEKITRALFLLAARDPTGSGPAIVNALEMTTPEEQAIFAGGLARQKRRREVRNDHPSSLIPTSEEQQAVHNLYLRTKMDDFSPTKRALPSGCVWMEDFIISNNIFSQPENRNLHNAVFGGFLMRQALEISWLLGYQFSKHRPHLKSISDIVFVRPVAVSSLLKMYAHVIYTEKQHFQIMVYAETFTPNSEKRDTSNIFHFTYEVPQFVPEVFPKTYLEAMMYIDGLRHYQTIMHSKK